MKAVSSLRFWLAALGTCCVGIAPARAQVAASGEIARHIALGGGGIALADRYASPQVNPAFLADPVELRFNLSRMGVTGQGNAAYKAWDILVRTNDFDRLTDIALDLARQRTRMTTENGFDVRFGHWQVDIGAIGQLDGVPNAALKQWVRQGAAFYPPPGARFQADMGYFVTPSVAYGNRWNLNGDVAGELDAGLRVKEWYGRWRSVQFRAVREGTGFSLGRDTLGDKTGGTIGADLGLRFKPKDNPRLSYGLVVAGAAAPAIGNMTQDPTLNVGSAYQVTHRLTVVADALNLSSSNDRRAKLATGAEYALYGRWLTVQGGLSTRGLSAGFGLGPLHFAYSRDGETSLGTQLRF